ncbi:hypothetical protein AX17_003677 [Amanita inopinata Kibby_2008]|nr:hypothetical protein AX17_003677 [Amanita inopinata Kibby_2008]
MPTRLAINQQRLPSLSDLNRITGSPPIQYNFQHDLESLWWILLWTVTRGIDHEPSRTFASETFCNTLKAPATRVKVFRDSKYLMDRLERFLHLSVQDFIPSLVIALTNLRTAYYIREMNEELYDIGSYSEAYSTMDIIPETLKNIAAAPGKLELHRQQPPSSDRTSLSKVRAPYNGYNHHSMALKLVMKMNRTSFKKGPLSLSLPAATQSTGRNKDLAIIFSSFEYY